MWYYKITTDYLIDYSFAQLKQIFLRTCVFAAIDPCFHIIWHSIVWATEAEIFYQEKTTFI